MNAFLEFLPPNMARRAQVYIRLTRADKPIGTLLLLAPTLWALLLAGNGRVPLVETICFVAGTFLMRSAGCVANDLADRNFDGKVERTQNRPFAQGEVSVLEAIVLIVILCLLALLCLLPLNRETWAMSLPALFLALSYPLTKRFFAVPQLYLGLAFSFGIPMAFTALMGSTSWLAWELFIANVFWTLAYDTIYAMADKEDDLKIGIKTSAITFGRYDAEMAVLCHGLFSLMMVKIGLDIGAYWPYWLAFVLVLFHQWRQYGKIVGRDRQACFETFLSNNQIGWIWFLGILAHFAAV